MTPQVISDALWRDKPSGNMPNGAEQNARRPNH